jgi:hypothetical protein
LLLLFFCLQSYALCRPVTASAMRSSDSGGISEREANVYLARCQDDLTACVQQLCSTSKLRDLTRRLARMEDTLELYLKCACNSSASLDSSSYSRVLRQLLTIYSHAMHLVIKRSDEQAVSDALLLTAHAIEGIGLALRQST